VRCASFRQLRFLYDDAEDAFTVERSAEPLADAAALGLQPTDGLPEAEAARRLRWHGRNLIDVEMPSIARQLTDEILNPFVFFQCFSCVQWLLQQYWHYSLIVFAITIAAAAFSLVSSRRSFRRLRDLSRLVVPTRVRRGCAPARVIPSDQLVPGDCFEVVEGMDFPCDALLVAGECLVSEAMLTGESVPVAKAPLAGARSQLSGGTHVLQARGEPHNAPVLARVSRTGFSTEKGRLVRSILFPRSGRMDLTRDGNRFVAFVLVPMAVAGGIASSVHALRRGGDFTVASALDLVSIAVPPALPAAMMVGIATAVDRLRRRGIFCIAPNRVNMAGRVTQVCFDKTGTLTLDGLTMRGLRPARVLGGCATFCEEVPADGVAAACDVAAAVTPTECLALVMAACQSLRHRDRPGGAELVGDPLEAVMLCSSGWRMDRLADGGVRLLSPGGALGAIQLQSFDFNSELARMAVVVRILPSGEARVLVKGSPEAISLLCAPETLPPDFERVLAAYAGGGYRVIGCAERPLDATAAAAATAGVLTRDQAEGDGGAAVLRFVGLVVLENPLKPSSAGVVAALQAARMGVCMVTGDHARTAVTVARAANILGPEETCMLVDAAASGGATYTLLGLTPVQPDRRLEAEEALGPACAACRFVATGGGFSVLAAAAEDGDTTPLHAVMQRLSVAARFQPHQKQAVVGLFMERGYYTAFVGDGANDSAALKAADVGLSLTADAEASVAAPFTSRGADVTSIVTLLLEGRAALATSFQLFKFMALYAIVQFSCSLQMNLVESYLAEYEFLWVDLFLVLPLSALLPLTRAYTELSARRPASSLLQPVVIASVVGQAVLAFGFQLAMRQLTRDQCWWQPVGFQCCSAGNAAPSPASAPATCPLRQMISVDACLSCGSAFKNIVPGYENTALWHLANFQYIWLAASLAVSRPFRQPQWTNLPFSMLWLTLLLANVALLFCGSPAIDAFFECVDMASCAVACADFFLLAGSLCCPNTTSGGRLRLSDFSQGFLPSASRLPSRNGTQSRMAFRALCCRVYFRRGERAN
jgi:predicted P-type ATPase